MFGLKDSSGTDKAQNREGEGKLCKPKSYVLCGMGGIGKTEIAIEYLYSRRSQFDDVFWIYADAKRKLAAQFSTIAKELRIEAASDGMDEESARDVVHEWLAAPTSYGSKNGKSEKVKATWLIIFDNADEPDTLYD